MVSINLTTTLQRIPLCRIALTSLLSQSHCPDCINLWVSENPYLEDSGISPDDVESLLLDFLPEKNRDLIHVHWVGNTGPYRKLMPILRAAEDSEVIVTADDDIFYGKHWLSKLLEAYGRSGCKAVAARVRIKRINFIGRKTSYLYWKIKSEPTILAENFVVTFGGGAVLRRSMFRPHDILDDSYLNVAPTADDLWYSKLLRLNNNKIVVVPSALEELFFVEHNLGLANCNFPNTKTLLRKVRSRIWDRPVGFLGGPVCGNDVASRRIDDYFQM